MYERFKFLMEMYIFWETYMFENSFFSDVCILL